MALELDDIKRLHDKAFQSGQATRDKASDDLVFYWITQWDDAMLDDSQLAFKGEFNMLRKAGRDIMSGLRSNPVQVDFEPKDPNRMDSADILDGIYRSVDRQNYSVEAYNNAMQEMVVCGIGGWELYADYETSALGDKQQTIKRRPIYEANNKVFWDPNAKMLDKSDATYVSVLESYSEDGYKALIAKLSNIPEADVVVSNFATPNQSFVFPWVSGDIHYVTRFFHSEVKEEKNIFLTDPFGQEIVMRDFELAKIEDELLDAGFEITGEKKVERTVVTLYIASGSEIIYSARIAGQHIPIVPAYGERAFIEGEEHYEGVTRLAKDPQRLRNFQLSYLADMVSRSPRPKPIFTPEQVAGFEFMFEDNGADNNYPYLLQNMVDKSGKPLPLGPVGQLIDQPIPQALAASIDITRGAIEDVANPGLPQNIADPDLSGKAVIALQNMLDRQTYVYQDHMKFAKRRDGEIFASMASEIIDTPREVTLTLPDGSRKKTKIMDTVVDTKTGDIVAINDITGLEFEVYADIGQAYSTRKEQTLDQLSTAIADLLPQDPLRNILMLKKINLMGGVDFDDVRDYANNQLILMGIRKPETPEEEQLLAQAQQAQQGQQDPNMVLAMAEMKKAQVQEFDLQLKQQAQQIEVMKLQQKAAVDGNDARLKEAEIISNIRNKDADTIKKMAEAGSIQNQSVGYQLDTLSKLGQGLRGRANQ